jgi:hypothetical protein
MILVKSYEIAERDRKSHFLIRVEGIEAGRVFETGNDQGKTEGIQTGLQQLQIIREASKLSLLFQRNFLELRSYYGSERHEQSPAKMMEI